MVGEVDVVGGDAGDAGGVYDGVEGEEVLVCVLEDEVGGLVGGDWEAATQP